MWTPSRVLHSSFVPFSLPLSAEQSADDSSIRETPTKGQGGSLTSSSTCQSLLAALISSDLLLSPSPSALVRASLPLSTSLSTTPETAYVDAECSPSSSGDVAIPESPPWQAGPHPSDDSPLFTPTAIRLWYSLQPRQRADIDPYTLYCASTDGQYPLDGGRDTQIQASPPNALHTRLPYLQHSPPRLQPDPLSSPQTVQQAPVFQSPSRLVSLCSAIDRASSDASPFAERASLSLSLDMSYIDLPSQLHQPRDSPSHNELKAHTTATLSLSYQSTTQASLLPSQPLDQSAASPSALPFPRLSEGLLSTDTAESAATTSPSQPLFTPLQRRVGAYRVDPSGVLLPSMRSALVPAAAAGDDSKVNVAGTANATHTEQQLDRVSALPAASSDLRALYQRMLDMLAALTGCGCHPYHVRVLRLASAALQSLCERESLFATRETLALQAGCTRDVLQWVDHFDLDAHSRQCADRRKQRAAVAQMRAAAQSRRAAEWQKAAAGKDLTTTQLSVRHNSGFSYPSSECTA